MKKRERTPYEKLSVLFEAIVDKDYVVGLRKDSNNELAVYIADKDSYIVQAMRFDLLEHSVSDIVDGMDILRQEVAFKLSRKKKGASPS